MSQNRFELVVISDKNYWESKVSRFKESNFLQSYNWGEFQKSMDKLVLRYEIKDKLNTVGMMQLVKEPASRGPYLSVAGGPLIDWQNQELVSWVFESIKTIAKENKVWFIRFRPQVEESIELCSLVESLGAVASPMHLTADLTLQLDLTNSEELILSSMRKNHRNLIRRAQKQGVRTEISMDPNFIDEFFKWQDYLAKKHDFVPFSLDFLKNQFKAFMIDNQVMFINSYLSDTLLASAFIIIYNNEAVYHYGVSTPANEKLPGSYAVQWRAISEAKLRGAKVYNFWGIAPELDKDHRFAGVSLFKRGFGGKEVQYLKAHDIPVSPLYKATNLFEQIRKKKRNL